MPAVPHGHVELLRHQSRVLAGNPLGDPTVRQIGVYLPPSYLRDAPRRRYPVVYLLAGYTGHGPSQLLARSPWVPTLAERFDHLIASRKMQDTIVVLPDCFTRYGGSQYVDSPAIGRYATYVTDEVIPFIDDTLRTIPKRAARAILGKSSGGYGALTLAMKRPDLFSAVGSHAGDSAFDLCYARELPQTALELERRGGLRGWLKWFDAQPTKSGHAVMIMSNLCCAAAWSPSARGPYAYGRGFDLPMDLKTGALKRDVWQRWLNADPVRMLLDKHNVAALRKMKTIYLDAGLSDEFMLQLGTRQISERLTNAKIKHVHEEFEGGHMNTPWRYERSMAVLTRGLG